MAGQKDLQVGKAVGHLFSGNKDFQCAVRIGAHYVLHNNTETKAYFFCLANLCSNQKHGCCKIVLNHKTSENCLWVSKLGQAEADNLESYSQET